MTWRTDKPVSSGYYLATWKHAPTGALFVSEIYYDVYDHRWWTGRGYFGAEEITSGAVMEEVLDVTAWREKPAPYDPLKHPLIGIRDASAEQTRADATVQIDSLRAQRDEALDEISKLQDELNAMKAQLDISDKTLESAAASHRRLETERDAAVREAELELARMRSVYEAACELRDRFEIVKTASTTHCRGVITRPPSVEQELTLCDAVDTARKGTL